MDNSIQALEDKPLRGSFIACVIALLLFLGFIGDASANSGPFISISPSKGKPGTKVTLDGKGFTPNAQVIIAANPEGIIISKGKSDHKGNIHLSLPIPPQEKIPNLEGNNLRIFAVEPVSGKQSNEVQFNYLGSDTLGILATVKAFEFSIKLKVSEDEANKNYTFWAVYGPPNSSQVAHRLTDPDGDLVYTFTDEVVGKSLLIVKIVRGTGVKTTSTGAEPGDPQLVLQDLGVVEVNRNITLEINETSANKEAPEVEAATSRNLVPQGLPLTGGGGMSIWDRFCYMESHKLPGVRK